MPVSLDDLEPVESTAPSVTSAKPGDINWGDYEPVETDPEALKRGTEISSDLFNRARNALNIGMQSQQLSAQEKAAAFPQAMEGFGIPAQTMAALQSPAAGAASELGQQQNAFARDPIGTAIRQHIAQTPDTGLAQWAFTPIEPPAIQRHPGEFDEAEQAKLASQIAPVIARIQQEQDAVNKALAPWVHNLEGLNQNIAEAAKFGRSPVGLATSLLGAAPRVIQKLVSGGFAYDMISKSREASKALDEEMAKPKDQQDPQKIGKLQADLETLGAFATLATAHALPKVGVTFGPRGPIPESVPTAPRQLPEPFTDIEEVQPGEPYAEAIRRNQGLLPAPGVPGETGQGNRGPNVEPPAPRQPEPVVEGKEVKGEAKGPPVTVNDILAFHPREVEAADVLNLSDADIVELHEARDPQGKLMFPAQVIAAAYGGRVHPDRIQQIGDIVSNLAKEEGEKFAGLVKSNAAAYEKLYALEDSENPDAAELVKAEQAVHDSNIGIKASQIRQGWLDNIRQGLDRKGVNYDLAVQQGLVKPTETPPAAPQSQPPATTVAPRPLSDLAGLTPDELDALMGQVGAAPPPAAPAPAPAPPAAPPTTGTTPPPTIDKAIQQALEGAKEAWKGLEDLFGPGGGNVGSGAGAFNEKTYEKAKPHFKAAFDQFVASGKTLLEFLKYCIDKWGEAIRPYVKRFVEDMAKEQAEKGKKPQGEVPALPQTDEQKRAEYTKIVTDRARKANPNLPETFWNGPWKSMLDQHVADFDIGMIDFALRANRKGMALNIDSPETSAMKNVADFYDEAYEAIREGNLQYLDTYYGETHVEADVDELHFYPERDSLRQTNIDAGNSWHSDRGNVLTVPIADLDKNRTVAEIWDFFRAVNEAAYDEDKAKEAAEETEGEPPTPPQLEEGSETAATLKAAGDISQRLEAGQGITKQEAHDIMARHHGGTMAEGKFTAKDQSDVIEMAVNLYINRHFQRYNPEANASNAIGIIRDLKLLMERLPTQTTRTPETDKMQQFSTPPTEAFAAAWVANLNPDDVVLEPSAGIGGLAVFAKNAGARVIANELSPRRNAMLQQLGFADHVTPYNAERIDAMLHPKIKDGSIPQPTAVLMNPPFSSSATGLANRTMIGAGHVESALKTLPPGGRLVAIVGEGMAHDRPAFKEWWKRISSKYNVRANVGVSGEEYRKYGTTFGNQLIVIDNNGPTPAGGTITGKVDQVQDLIPMLEKVRNDRPRVEQRPTQPGSPQTPSTGGRPVPTPSNVPPVPAAGRPGSRRGQPGGGGRPPVAGGGQLPVVTTPPSVSTGPAPGLPGSPGTASGPAAGTGETGGAVPGVSEQELRVEKKEGERVLNELGIFSEYKPQKVHIPGSKPHTTPLVETTAMASVEPVDPTYQPRLSKDVIEKGALSDAQLEQIVYAGQAHQQFLPTGERMGYFVGDGTGVGKSRIGGGILVDNWNQGRRKHIWLTKDKKLIGGLEGELKEIGFDGKVINMAKSPKDLAKHREGVAFSNYASMTMNNPGIDRATQDSDFPKLNPDTDPERPSRLTQLYKWAGKDFDGVIILDESHKAGNAIDIRGERGIDYASNLGKMVVDLQKLFPKARVVYMSATGATDVTNLSYADRLGIWGHGTPFPSKQAFFDSIRSGGLSAMEIVARDLKSMGRYLARTLSFEGVTNEQLVHKLTPEQRDIYNKLSDGWQTVMESFRDTMAQTGAAMNGAARRDANSALFRAQQAFYNQLLTAMQMPSVIERIKKALANGESVVIQLVNTNEATLQRELAAKGQGAEEGDESYLEDLDLSPKTILLQLIDKNFPTQLFQEETDGEGNTSWKPVRDSDGNPVQDPQALETKQRLMDEIGLLRSPTNPIDMIMDTFGVENVAEMTGRGSRSVDKLQADGTRKRVLEVNRSDSIRLREFGDFNDLLRRILIFSDAGGTGFDYHSSRRIKNQQHRVHILLQAGWRADNAVQGLGRTNRTDQASAPHIVLASTDIEGHKRFISTIARRLAELGSITGGERKSAARELFDESNNLENRYAQSAVTRYFRDLFAGEIEGQSFGDITKKLGFVRKVMNPRTGEMEEINELINPRTGSLNDTKIPTIQRFLNRILMLNVDQQNAVFDAFNQRRLDMIEAAKADGSYDPGTQTVRALAIRKTADEVVWSDPNSTSKTRLVTIESDHPVKTYSWDQRNTVAPDRPVVMYVQNIRSGKVFALKEGPQRTMENGSIIDTWRRIGPTGFDIVGRNSIDTEEYYGHKPTYRNLNEDQAQALWDDQFSNAPKVRTDKDTYVVGAFLPIWDRLKLDQPRIWRMKTDKGENILGAHVPARAVAALRERLGAAGSERLTPEDAFNKVLNDGQPIELSNGWTIKRSRVQGDQRIEVTGVTSSQMQEWTQFIGGFIERINFTPRFFVPTDEATGIPAIKRILDKAPPITRRGNDDHGLDNLRIDPGPGTQFGLVPLIWNSLIDVIKLAIAAGKKLRDAIRWGIREIKRRYPRVQFDENGAAEYLENAPRGGGGFAAAESAAHEAARMSGGLVPEGTRAVPIPGTESRFREALDTLRDLPAQTRLFLRSAAMAQLPRITAANREAGEAGVRYAVSPQVAREHGLIFASKVMEGITERNFDQKLGSAVSEDNLRDIKQRNLDLADEIRHRDEHIAIAQEEIENLQEEADAGDRLAKRTIRELRQRIERLQGYTDEDAERLEEMAQNTFTFIGKPGSPFPTEESYQQFLASDNARTALGRHRERWRQEKDPLFRSAADLDPDVPLETRGLETDARINLKPVWTREEHSRTTVGAGRSTLTRQSATLKRRNPFASRAEGQGTAYEGSYTELMANGFEREMPVARQHEFIKALIDSGNAVLTDRENRPGLVINGEPTKGYMMRMRAWRNRWLQVPRSLADEYESVTGLRPAARIKIFTAMANFLTRQSIMGLAEGSTHIANLMMEIFTGVGPTANPLINTLLKSIGRADLLYRLPRVLIRGMMANREEMLDLATIGATKQPYGGIIGGALNWVDKGVRLNAADIYRGMAQNGWVADTETGLREFVNQVGNYNKKLQPWLIQALRDTHVQPFATAIHTFNVMGVRRMLLKPGAQGPTLGARMALRADILAGWIGFLVLVAALNWLVSGDAEGPKGTRIGAVGWVGDDGKLHQFDVGALTGFLRGPRATGLQAFIEAQRSGLSGNTALAASGRAIGNTALNYVAGPGVRTLAVGLTGSRPGVPMTQEAKVVPPQPEMDVLKSQTAENVKTALRQVNPIVDSMMSVVDGQPMSDIAERQLSRYTPRGGMSTQTIDRLPRIVRQSEINAYADAIAREARKQPLSTRGKWIMDRMNQDQISPETRSRAIIELRKKGAYIYP